MKIRTINPNNENDIKAMDILERSSFELTGNDPTECPQAIGYIAQQGIIFLGYEIAIKGENIPKDLVEVVGADRAKGGEEIPVGFIELIALDKSLEFYRENKGNAELAESPFILSKKNADRIYEFARRYAKDCDIIDHHGIGIHAEYQGSGRGNQLLRHAMTSDFVSGKVVDCNVDILLREDGGLVDIFNDRSFALHLNNEGFIATSVIEPPVYKDSIVYAATVKLPNPVVFDQDKVNLNINDLRQKPADLLSRLDVLSRNGYVAIRYDSRNQKMEFVRIK